jgi:hypothetical protein
MISMVKKVSREASVAAVMELIWEELIWEGGIVSRPGTQMTYSSSSSQAVCCRRPIFSLDFFHTLFFTVGADPDDDFSGIRSFSFSSSGHGGVPQQQQGLGGMHGGFFPSFGGFGGTHGMSGMNGFGSGGVAGFGRKEPPVVRDISLTLVCKLLEPRL